ncbi:hypothetical protein COCVIDRAFT_11269 [Bipolaris victoriae FI3]|uniref:Uncharacterized protein n=1 Tax=Bipolaris victoriae (strain FI3) TaxID=930091 RepID=W7F406_BIPV3|nr:hypothetical protein COCVIDRAFT_11269 [Bipolaris victoriae FI3]
MPAYAQSPSHQLSAAESVEPTTSPAASHALTAITAGRGDISLGAIVPPRTPFALDNDQGAEIFQCNARHTCLTTLLSCYFHLSNSALGHDNYLLRNCPCRGAPPDKLHRAPVGGLQRRTGAEYPLTPLCITKHVSQATYVISTYISHILMCVDIWSCGHMPVPGPCG